MEDRKQNPGNPANPANSEKKDALAKKEAPEKVAVPAEVLQGINVVRYSGLTNMLDRPKVAQLAKTFGFPGASKWVKDHPKEYAEGLFRGFGIDPER
ncbi:MAG: DUF5049 domain-containing protein [Thermodesulfobacteriota bacterium]